MGGPRAGARGPPCWCRGSRARRGRGGLGRGRTRNRQVVADRLASARRFHRPAAAAADRDVPADASPARGTGAPGGRHPPWRRGRHAGPADRNRRDGPGDGDDRITARGHAAAADGAGGRQSAVRARTGRRHGARASPGDRPRRRRDFGRGGTVASLAGRRADRPAQLRFGRHGEDAADGRAARRQVRGHRPGRGCTSRRRNWRPGSRRRWQRAS
jgi:hypothetical protein